MKTEMKEGKINNNTNKLAWNEWKRSKIRPSNEGKKRNNVYIVIITFMQVI
jgi:hypothetical protein